MSVSTRISRVAGEYETAWEPIGKPLYWTENRRLPSAAGKAIAVAALAIPGKAQPTAPANPPIRSARRGMGETFLAGRTCNTLWPRLSIQFFQHLGGIDRSERAPRALPVGKIRRSAIILEENDYTKNRIF